MHIIKRAIIPVLIAIFAILLAYNHGRNFRNKHNIALGTITYCDGGGKGNFGPGIHFSYYVGGKLINDSRRAGDLPYSIGKIITGKKFPVAYEKYWFGYEGAILMTPHDFAIYNHPFPDSLVWIEKYIIKK